MIPAVRRKSDPAIDPEAVERFAQVAFRGLNGFLDVRLLTDKGMPAQPPRCYALPVDDGLVPALVRCAVEALTMGRACYVVPAVTEKRGRATAGSVTETAVVLFDLDDGDIASKRAHLVTYLGPPTLVVASGGATEAGEPKLHLYWRLAQPASGFDLDRVRQVREAAARKVGGDLSVAKVQQPIRLAGSVHCKHGRRSPVRILEVTERVYEIDALERLVEAMPSIGSPDEIAEDDEIASAQRASPIRAGGADGITRFDALSSCIGERIRKVRLGDMTRAEAWQEVARFNAEWVVPSWDEARLRREFEAIERVDRLNHGGCRDATNDLDRTEHGLARRLADEHAATWRYVPGIGWLSWTGSCWRPDETSRILEVCRRLCEDAAARQSNPDRRRLLSDRTIRAVERLARSDPRLAANAAEWDRDAMLLNTPRGVIDLCTGEVLPNDPRRQMTRITGAALGDACPRWLAFIARISAGDGDMAAYLQRIAGYCLTARTDEQAFFFLHGSGANGKTVFLEALADVLGSYARTAPLDTFMAARADRQQNDLAGLDSARMVIATETEAGRPWAEARIKAVTGGDRISVRRLYGEFFETTPGYKLLIAGNHRPRLTGGGSGMARRLHLIPFETVIPEHERDGRLREKLLVERDGILGWMLEGCRNWADRGLQPPKKVRDAVASYFDTEDFVAEWIGECCEVGDAHVATTAELYGSWRRYAESLGLVSGNARDLGERLGALGYRSIRTSKSRGWKGLRPLLTGEMNETVEASKAGECAPLPHLERPSRGASGEGDVAGGVPASTESRS